MLKEFREHYSKRKTSLVLTAATGALISVPTYHFVTLVMPFGVLIYVPAFTLYFFSVIVLWHYAKDRIVYWWGDRSK